jgi:hypothetical protein
LLEKIAERGEISFEKPLPLADDVTDASQDRHGAPAVSLVKIAARVTPGHPLPKVLKATEDAHTKSMSIFETDEHLQASGPSRRSARSLRRSG